MRVEVGNYFFALRMFDIIIRKESYEVNNSRMRLCNAQLQAENRFLPKFAANF